MREFVEKLSIENTNGGRRIRHQSQNNLYSRPLKWKSHLTFLKWENIFFKYNFERVREQFWKKREYNLEKVESTILKKWENNFEKKWENNFEKSERTFLKKVIVQFWKKWENNLENKVREHFLKKWARRVQQKMPVFTICKIVTIESTKLRSFFYFLDFIIENQIERSSYLSCHGWLLLTKSCPCRK